MGIVPKDSDVKSVQKTSTVIAVLYIGIFTLFAGGGIGKLRDWVVFLSSGTHPTAAIGSGGVAPVINPGNQTVTPNPSQTPFNTGSQGPTTQPPAPTSGNPWQTTSP